MKDLLNNTVDRENENVVYETKLHWVSYVRPIISLIISLSFVWFISLFIEPYKEFYWIVKILCFLLVLETAHTIYKLLYLKRIKIYLTKKSLTLKQGIFSKELTDISLSKYEGMGLHQSLLGRVLGYGTLSITTGGASQSYQIEEPMKLRGYILELIK